MIALGSLESILGEPDGHMTGYQNEGRTRSDDRNIDPEDPSRETEDGHSDDTSVQPPLRCRGEEPVDLATPVDEKPELLSGAGRQPLESLHLGHTSRSDVEVATRPSVMRAEHNIDSAVATMEGLSSKLDLEGPRRVRHLELAGNHHRPALTIGRFRLVMERQRAPTPAGNSGQEDLGITGEEPNQSGVVSRPAIGAESPRQRRWARRHRLTVRNRRRCSARQRRG